MIFSLMYIFIVVINGTVLSDWHRLKMLPNWPYILRFTYATFMSISNLCHTQDFLCTSSTIGYSFGRLVVSWGRSHFLRIFLEGCFFLGQSDQYIYCIVYYGTIFDVSQNLSGSQFFKKITQCLKWRFFFIYSHRGMYYFILKRALEKIEIQN